MSGCDWPQGQESTAWRSQDSGGQLTFFFPAPYGSRKERIILGPRDLIGSLLRRPWSLNAADLHTYYSLPIISTYFTDSIHCFTLPTKEFMKRIYKYQWKKFSIIWFLFLCCTFGHSGVPRNFFGRRGVQQIQLRKEDREKGDLGVVAPSQGFWRQLWFGTRNFISYSKIFLIFGNLGLFMVTTNLFVIANVKQSRTDRSFRIILFFPNIMGFWRPKSSDF